MTDISHLKDKVKNIIFDLGGVLLHIDYERVQREFENIGVCNFQELYTQANQSKLFDELECGQISNEEFLDELAKYLPSFVDSKKLAEVWNSMLGAMPKERLDLVYRLKGKYRTFLLSNTNAIHIQAFEDIIGSSIGMEHFNGAFEKTYYSSDIGMRKPDEEVFKKVCAWNNLKPEETLFIDDSEQHVIGAQKAGLQAYYLDLKREDVMTVFKNW